MVADAGLRSQLGPGAGLPVRQQAGMRSGKKQSRRAHGRSQMLEKDNNETYLGNKVTVQ